MAFVPLLDEHAVGGQQPGVAAGAVLVDVVLVEQLADGIGVPPGQEVGRARACGRRCRPELLNRFVMPGPDPQDSAPALPDKTSPATPRPLSSAPEVFCLLR